jgi:hypothetical protein
MNVGILFVDVKSTHSLDKWGMRASTLCAVHCVAVPLLLTLLPFGGLMWLKSSSLEAGIIGSSVLLAVAAHTRGFRIHGRCAPAVICASGIALIVLCRFFEDRGAWIGSFAALAGLTIAASHWLNHRLCNSCAVCHPKEAVKGRP